MKTACFILELLQDTVISERGATEGGHGSLDYLSGAAILGAVAAKLYKTLPSSEETYLAFHSGKLRFHNALPLDPAGLPTYPIPLAWHEEKQTEAGQDSAAIKDNCLRPRHIRFPSEKSDTQLKQLRGGYFSLGKMVARPDKNLRMKTAIDPDTGPSVSDYLSPG